MWANTTATVKILCGQGIFLNFNQLRLIHISEITFVDCSMSLGSIVNATFMGNSFLNKTTRGFALNIYDSSVWIEQCTISNNSNGAIDFSGSTSLTIIIDQSIFNNNNGYSYSGYGYHYYHAAIEINMHTYSYGGISSDGHISRLWAHVKCI